MTQQETIEANRLLAEFMGCRDIKNGRCTIDRDIFWHIFKVHGMSSAVYNNRPILFHKSWDWILVVVAKIAKVCEPTTECDINRERVELFKTVTIFSDISEVYKCCVNFVKWYNENKAI